MELSVFICASPRSGSYLLSDLLRNCGLPFAEEWLTDFHISSRKRAYGQDESMDFLPYLKMLSERERVDGIFATKVMYPQFRKLIREIGNRDDLPGDNWYSKLSFLFPNPRFVYITREDKLSQAVSHFKARQTGSWILKKGEKRKEEGDLIYSFLGILRHLGDHQICDQLWNQHFVEVGIEPCRIAHEHLIHDRPGTLKTILSYLGAGKLERGGFSHPEKFSKMSTSINRQWKIRFLEDRNSCPDRVVTTREPFSSPEIRCREIKQPFILKRPNIIKIEVQLPPGEIIDFRGNKDGTGWLRIAGLLAGKGFCDHFEQELRPESNTILTARWYLPDPPVDGDFELKLVVSDKSLNREEISQADGVLFPVSFSFPPPLDKARKLFKDVRDLDDGWQYLDWFGYFLDDKFPWVYHCQHEWLYFESEPMPDGRLKVLDANMGWVAIDPRRYPEIESLESDEQWIFIRREKDKRVLKDSAGKACLFETNRPEHLAEL